MNHWCEQYIGTPWARSANGPHEFDCYGLVRHIQATHFGKSMPEVSVDSTNARVTRRNFKTHMEHKNWERVDSPEEGDCVEMGEGKYVNHIGVWVSADGGGVIHCVQGAGTVFSKQNTVGFAWPLIIYWRSKQ